MIYIIHCDGYCKIGYSGSDPADRLKALQIGSPHQMSLVAVAPGSQLDEIELHRQYAHCRVRGEWFELAWEDVRTIVLTQSFWGYTDFPDFGRPVIVGPEVEEWVDEIDLA